MSVYLGCVVRDPGASSSALHCATFRKATLIILFLHRAASAPFAADRKVDGKPTAALHACMSGFKGSLTLCRVSKEDVFVFKPLCRTFVKTSNPNDCKCMRIYCSIHAKMEFQDFLFVSNTELQITGLLNKLFFMFFT